MKKPLSIIDQIMKQMKDLEGEVGYKVTPSNDKMKFGLPDNLTKPMNEQLQAVLISPGQGKTPTKFKPQINDKQFKDDNKQLQLPASSTIQQAAYWPKKQYLVVSFKSGATYSYDEVPLLTVLFWEQASSAGSWFYYNIRMSYRYQKLG